MGRNKNTSRGQIAVEFAVILAFALIILLVVAVLSNERLIDISTQKQMNDARTSVRDLADAATQVYQQGLGARKRVFVMIPGDTDLNLSFIGRPAGSDNSTQSNTILLSFRSTDIVATTVPEVHGSWPKTTGGHWMWVESKGSYVTVGNAYLDVDIGSLYFNIVRSTSRTQSFNVYNRGEDKAINVTVSFSWSNDHVTVSASPNNFTLAPGGNRTVSIEVVSDAYSGGLYSGDIFFQGTGDGIDEIIQVPLTVEVELPVIIINQSGNITHGPIRVIPGTWTLKLGPNETASRNFIICTDETTYADSVTFTPSAGEPGAWVTNTAPIGPILPDSCDVKNLGIQMPASTTSGVKIGNISVVGGGYETFINLTIIADYTGPVASNLNTSPSKPRSRTSITVTARCDETTTYVNNISMGQVRVDTGAWQNMSASDGAYDEVIEDVTKNVGNYSGGWHNVSVRCIDSHGNFGSATSGQFRVYKDFLFVRLSSTPTAAETAWDTWFNTHSSGAGYAWSRDYATDDSFAAGTANATDYIIVFMTEYSASPPAGLNTAIASYMTAGGRVMMASGALQKGPRALGYTASDATTITQNALYISDNTHYITSPFGIGVLTVQSGSSNDMWLLQPDFITLGGTRLASRSATFSTYTIIGYRGSLVVFGQVWDPSRYNADGNTLATRSVDYCLVNSGLQ